MQIEETQVISEEEKKDVRSGFQNWSQIAPSVESKGYKEIQQPENMPNMKGSTLTDDWTKLPPVAAYEKELESEELRNWVIQNTENPEEELAKLRGAQHFAITNDLDPDYVYDNFEELTKEYYGQEMTGTGFWETVNNSRKTGIIQSELGDLYWQRISGDESEETLARIEELKAQLPSIDEQKRWIPTQALKAVMEMSPMMIDSMAAGAGKGLAYGVGGATVAAIGGQAGPQIATPEEIITVPAAFTAMYFVGQAAGSSEKMMQKEAGLAYMDMLDFEDSEGNKIDPEIARNISIAIGAVNGVIEASQVANIPGVDALINKATKQVVKDMIKTGTFQSIALQFSKKYAGNIGSETAQEILQETVNIIGENVARAKSGLDPATARDTEKRLTDTAYQSALAFSLMGLPGSVVNSDVSAAVRQMRGSEGIIKVNENTVIPGPDAKMYRSSGTSIAAPVANIEPTTPINTQSDSYKLARQQYEDAKAGNGTIAPIKVTQGEDGSYQAVDNDMLQVLLENGERAVEVELVAGPQVSPAIVADSKPDWMKSSREFSDGQNRFIDENINFRTVQAREDLEYNLSQAVPNMAREDVGTLTDMFDMIAAASGMETAEYVQKYYADGMFSTGKINTEKIYDAAARMVEDGKRILHITKKTDFTSIVHEATHVIRGHLPEADLSILSDYYKDEEFTASGRWSVAMEEKFTSDLMLYMEKGIAPTEQHRELFSRIAQGIKKVYDVIARKEKGGEEVPEHIKAVFDRIFTPQGEVKADSKLGVQNRIVAQESADIAREADLILFQQAFHGGAHEFDKFSTSHIGNGTGYNNFGWGLYFSDKKDVAEWYADQAAEDGQRNLYSVDMADDMNWLEWSDEMTRENADKIKKYSSRIFPKKGKGRNLWEIMTRKNPKLEKKLKTGGLFYRDMENVLGDKLTSKLMKKAGIDGVKFPIHMDDESAGFNYVVFDEQDVQINNHVLFQESDKQEIREYLDGPAIAETDGKAVPEFDNKKDLTEWAQNWVKTENKENIHREDIGDITLAKRGFKSALSHGLTKPKAQSIVLIPEVVDKGKLVYSGNDRGRIAHVVAAPVEIDGEGYIQLVQLNETSMDDHRLKNHEVVLIKKAQNASIPVDSEERSLGHFGLLKSIILELYGVKEDNTLFQDTEHEEIIRQAVEEFKPVPEDVLMEYIDRDWAQNEMHRRTVMKDYGWLLDLAAGMESPEELKDFILNMGGSQEIAAAKSLGQEGEDRFYQEIWSRANLVTREVANKQTVELYANKKAVMALAADMAADMGEWANRGVPGAIWTLANNSRWGTPTTEKQIQNAIKAVKGNTVELRTALADRYNDPSEQRQLAYEQEIEHATPETVQYGRMTAEDRMKEAMKTDDMEIRKMLLTGVGTDPETILKMDREMHLRIGTLRAQQTKEIEKLQKKLGKSATQIEDLINSKERLKQLAKDEKTEAVAAAIQETKDKIRTSLKKRQELQKIKERMRILSKSITRKPAENCHWSFKEEIRNLQDDVDPHFRWKKTAEALKKRREFYEQNPEIAKVINPEILKEINKKPLNEWSLLELEELNNKINQLREAGARKQKTIEAERKQEVLDLSARMAFEIGEGKIVTIPDFITSGEKYQDWKKTTVKQQIDFATLRPSRLLKMMGGEGSTLVKVFWNEMNKHQDESLRNAMERKEAGLNKMKELGITWKHLSQEMSVPGSTMEPMRIGEVIQLYIAQKNEKNMRAFIHGNNITNPHAYVRQLSDQERALGDFIAADFERHHERYGEAYSEDKNDVLGKVPGYFPMRRQNMLNEARNDEVMRDMGTSAGVMDGYASRNSTKKRIDIGDEHQAPIRMGAMELWMEEVEKQEHYIASARYIKKLHSILKNSTFQAAMVDKYGERSIKWMEKYINEFANPNLYKFYDATSLLFKTLRNNMAIAYLAYNTMTMAKQAPSLALFMGRVGPHRLVAAAGKFLANPIKALEFVNERDPQMKERSMDRFTEELKLEQKHPVMKVINKVGQVGMKPIMMIDKMATTIGWRAVYDANIMKGEEEAIRLAQEAVLETQPAARAKDLAEIYRSNEGLNWFLMFTNQVNQTWNILTADIPAAVRQGQVTNAMGMIAGLMVSFAGIAVLSGWKPWENDEPEEFATDALTQLGKSMANTLPVVGKSIASGMDGWWGTGVDPVPAASEIGKLIKTLSAVDTERLPKQVGKVAEGMAVLGGVPLMPIKRTIKAIEKGSDGEAEKAVLEFIGYHTED